MDSGATVLSRRGLPLALAVLVTACQDDDKPYLEFAGGGFIFNYRTANHYYGLVIRQKKPLPEGARLEARFETPNGMEIVTEPAVAGRLQYKFQTGDLDGILAGHSYVVVVALIDAEGTTLERLERSFQTTVDQSKLPDQPLVSGPGYAPN